MSKRAEHRRKHGRLTDVHPQQVEADVPWPSRSDLIGLGILVLLAIGMFADVLVMGSGRVLSHGATDLATQFLYWREFTAEEMRSGNLPLWNPHVYAGMPFLGWTQTALLYPPNWLDLVVESRHAVNWLIAGHVMLMGALTYWWVRRARLHPVAGLVGAVMAMFGCPYFLHVFGGHVSLLFAAAWIPMVLLSLDGWIATRAWRWILAGAFAVSMQALAGDPQSLYYTALALGLYLLFQIRGTTARWQVVAGVVAMYAFAGLLAAAQLLTSADVARETMRSGGLTLKFASMVSLAPESLLTFLTPGFFGDMLRVPYWGRWYLWEMTCFVGVINLVLAFLSLRSPSRDSNRRARILVVVAACLIVLALGANTPLFALLFRVLPGFDLFRGTAKFLILAAIFLAYSAAMGMDDLMRRRASRRLAAAGTAVAAVLVLFVSVSIWRDGGNALEQGSWGNFVRETGGSIESYMAKAKLVDPNFLAQTRANTVRVLAVAGVTLAALAALLFQLQRWPRTAWVVGLLAVCEVVVFSRALRPTFDWEETRRAKVDTFISSKSDPDDRIHYGPRPNVSMTLSRGDIWGYAPLTLKRYNEFIGYTQGIAPDNVSQYVKITRQHPMLQFVRCRYLFIRQDDKIITRNQESVLPRLQLCGRYRVAATRDEVFRAMSDSSFNARREVVLESAPSIDPVDVDQPGILSVEREDTDEIVIRANLTSPSILLITDAFARGWQAEPMSSDNSQRHYEVIPANHALRAVPLEAGQHWFRLVYLPRAFVIGKWISIVSWLVFAAATVFLWWQACRSGQSARRSDLSKGF